MTKHELLEAIAEMIENNSNIEAEDDDEVLLDGVLEFNEDISRDDMDLTIAFEDGTSFRITAEQLDGDSSEGSV